MGSGVDGLENPPVACMKGLEYTQSEDGCLVYDGAQVHFLNLTAYFVLLSCDGKTDTKAMAESLQNAFGLPVLPLADVDACLSTLRKIGLLAPQSKQHHLG